MSESVTNPASDANTATKSTPESNPTQQASQQAGHVADAAASGTESTATSTTPGGNQKEKASHEAAGASPEAARGNEPKHLEQPDPNSQAGKIRYSFYEEGGLGIVSFFAKNAVIDKVVCSLHNDGNYLRVVIPMPDGSIYYRYMRLFGPAAPGHANADQNVEHVEGGVRVIPRHNPYKVEVPLKKLPIGGVVPKWTSAEYVPGAIIAEGPEIITVLKDSESKSSTTRPPQTSHAKPKKDWDELEHEVEKEDEASKKDIGAFFRELYKNADEKTRLAMLKSFQTSNGTVLSTNWEEVSKTDYSQNIQPPKGQEFKSWKDLRK